VRQRPPPPSEWFERRHRDALVGRDAGAQQNREGDGGQHRDHRHHDQQLDQREAALAGRPGGASEVGRASRHLPFLSASTKNKNVAIS
jgi:hypothetical protein